jgi:hypothetical protein
VPTTFTDFDPAQPDGAVDNGAAALADVRNNDGALRAYVLLALFWGYTYSQSGGTAAQPTTIKLSKGTTTLRLTLTWGTTGGETNQVKTIVPEISTDSEASWAAVGGTITNTFDANGELTATSGGGGFLSKLWSLWGLVRKAIADLAAHVAATGTAVHGLGNMATQAKTAVDIDGGAIDGATVGDNVPPKITAKTYRGSMWVPASQSGAVALDLDTYDFFNFGMSGDITVSFTSTVATATAASAAAEITAAGANRTITWPVGTLFVGGAPPSPIPSGETHAFGFYRPAGSSAMRVTWLGKVA